MILVALIGGGIQISINNQNINEDIQTKIRSKFSDSVQRTERTNIFASNSVV
jgi:hypothetical protein